MKNPKNTLELIGKKFNRLTVISKEPNKVFNKSIFSMWKCICDCGNYYIAYGSALNKGKVKSCGCLKIEKARKEQGKAGFNDLYSEYKKRATKSGRVFNLTKESFFLLTQKNCFYCDSSPKNIHIPHHGRSEKSIKHEQYTYSGLDRVDSNKGYLLDNVVSSCKVCNIAKHNMSVSEFFEWIRRVNKRILDNEHFNSTSNLCPV